MTLVSSFQLSLPTASFLWLELQLFRHLSESIMLPTSQSLLARAKQISDASAWTELHDVYQPLIRVWLDRLAAPSSNLDDLSQEVLIVVMNKLPNFEHNQRVGAFRNWLRCVTVNCLRDFWKRNKFRPRTDAPGLDHSLVALEDENSELARNWDVEHDRFVVNSILQQIESDFEPQSWQAFKMLTLEEKTAEEVAEKLGIKRNAVYAIKSRVMTRLRQQSTGLVD